MTRPLNANRSAYRALLKAAAIARHARLARAVARAEDVVLREAIFTSRRHGGMTNCGCKLCAAVCDYVLAARANAKKGRNKK